MEKENSNSIFRTREISEKLKINYIENRSPVNIKNFYKKNNSFKNLNDVLKIRGSFVKGESEKNNFKDLSKKVKGNDENVPIIRILKKENRNIPDAMISNNDKKYTLNKSEESNLDQLDKLYRNKNIPNQINNYVYKFNSSSLNFNNLVIDNIKNKQNYFDVENKKRTEDNNNVLYFKNNTNGLNSNLSSMNTENDLIISKKNFFEKEGSNHKTKNLEESPYFKNFDLVDKKYTITENGFNNKQNIQLKRDYLIDKDIEPINEFEKLLFSTKNKKLNLNLNKDYKNGDLKFPNIFKTPQKLKTISNFDLSDRIVRPEKNIDDFNLKYNLKVLSNFKNKGINNMDLSIIKYSQISGNNKK